MKSTDYFDNIDEKIFDDLLPLILYIEKTYPKASYSKFYTEKSRMPTWRLHKSYVAIACRKKHISVYLGTEKAVQTVLESEPTCKVLKGCVNLSYHKEIPYQALYHGIDASFENKKRHNERDNSL